MFFTGIAMTELSIALAKYNGEGLVAYLENQDDDSLEIVLDRCTDDVDYVCTLAASRLRLLAEAFEMLAQCADACKPSTQKAAMKAAEKLRSDIIASASRSGKD